MSVTDMETTITGLTSDTSYAVEVAGVNVNGIGEYNDSLIVNTPQSEYICTWCVVFPVGGKALQSQHFVNIILSNSQLHLRLCITCCFV